MFAEDMYTYCFDENRKNTIRYSLANSVIERVRRSKLRAYALVARRARLITFSEVATLFEASLQVPAKVFMEVL